MWWFNRKGESGFSYSSTAEQVTQGIDGSGLTAIVTGASSGIGTETARVLALRGVHVIMAVRNMAAANEVKDAIVKDIPSAKVDAVELDLSSMASVKRFASEFNTSGRPLNILINNAGVMATPFKLSKDNIELQFATNHLEFDYAANCLELRSVAWVELFFLKDIDDVKSNARLRAIFFLTNLLLDNMKKTSQKTKKEGRILNVSSEAHRLTYGEGIRYDRIRDQKGYNIFAAYGQSKLANILHSNELARRLKDDGVEITANSLHPGVIRTNLFRYLGLMEGLISNLGKFMFKSVQQGASTTCYVALHPQVKGVNGEYFVDNNIGKRSSKATDMDLAKRLWDFSMDLTKSK